VSPIAERDVLSDVSVDVERFSILEPSLVPIGRREHEQQCAARRHRDSVVLDSLGEIAGNVGARGFEPQELFDGISDERAVVDQRSSLVGMLTEQRAHPAEETASGVEFRMLTNPGFTLAGVIVDQAGTPVKGMMVLLRADAKFDANGKVTEGPVGVSSSDANGRFVLGNVASGLYHISVDSTDAALRKAMLDGSVRSYIVTEGGPPAAGVDPMAVTVKDAIVDDLRIVLQSLQSR